MKSTMAPSPNSNVPRDLLSTRNVSAQDDDQAFKGMSPFDQAVVRGCDNRGDDDDISISENGSCLTKTKSEGSESSPSMRSSSGESSVATGVMSRIARDGNEEDRRICGARCLFFFVLLVAAVSLGSMVFVITSQSAHHDFEAEVRDDLNHLFLNISDP
jgi:hypothetical protein